MYRVSRAPARILKSKIEISLDGEALLTNKQNNFVRFPDGDSEWTFAVGESEFKSIMSKFHDSEGELIRRVNLKYQALDGGAAYSFEMRQSFSTAENQWQELSVGAD